MDRRQELHNKLLEHCPNVYFQPPEDLVMKFPCIVYSVNNINTTYASNKVYNVKNEWSLSYICRSVRETSIVIDILMDFDYCRFESEFIKDNLYNTVLKLHF